MERIALMIVSVAAVVFFVAPIVGIDVALISGVVDQLNFVVVK